MRHLKAALAILLVSLSVPCCTALAQDDDRREAEARQQAERAREQARHAIREAEHLKEQTQRAKIETERRIEQAVRTREELQALQKRYHESLKLFVEEKELKLVERLQQQLQGLSQELEPRLAEVEEAVSELFEMAEEIEESTREAAPSAEDLKLEVFRMKSLAAEHAAEVVEGLLEDMDLRVAVEERSNSIVIRAPEELIGLVRGTLSRIDLEHGYEQINAKENEHEDDPDGFHSLMVRVFWIANDSDDVGDWADSYFPESVVGALRSLGLKRPELVCQSVSTVLLEHGEQARWSLDSTAALESGTLKLECEGELGWLGTDKLPMEVLVRVSEKSAASMGMGGIGSPSNQVCELIGSTSVPLGHYVILGTANHATRSSVDKATQTAWNQLREEARVEWENSGRRLPPSPTAPPTNARFAFVVQVVEAESYTPEE